METILAIDLGKFKSVACVYSVSSKDCRYETIKTSKQNLHDLIIKVEPDVIAIEICNIAGWVCDLAEMLEVEIKVANPHDERWSWKKVKNKSDRKDALKLAKLTAMGELPLVHVPAKSVRGRRSLINYRYSLVQRSTQIKNSIRALLQAEDIAMPKGKSAWTLKYVEYLNQLADENMESGEVWPAKLKTELMMLETVQEAMVITEGKLDEMNAEDKNVKLMLTTPGVGLRLAETVSAYIDDPHRFENFKQVGCYAGLTQRENSSGEKSNKQSKGISGKGNKLLRSMLVEVSWLMLRYNSWARETYERIRRGDDKRKLIAIVAVARQLLVRLWAMMRDGTTWQMPAK